MMRMAGAILTLVLILPGRQLAAQTPSSAPPAQLPSALATAPDAPPAAGSTPSSHPVQSSAKLEDAPEIERQTIERLVKDPSWPRRALASLRLTRFDCQPSQAMLENMLNDSAWQVRTF